MNVFISHSWKNKNAAQLIAESLEGSANVWLDIHHLKPGDAIQPEIDEALTDMDIVLVLWSREAAKSIGVDAEIQTTARLKKKILPILLDDTPTDVHPLLKGLYGLNFDLEEPKPGLFRIQAGLARMMLGSMDMDTSAALNGLTSFEGFYQYIEEYRNKANKISGEDGTLWAIRAMEQCNKSYKSISDMREQVGDMLQFIQKTFTRVQEAGDNRDKIQSILNEVIRHPNSQTKEFKILTSFIEGKLSSLALEPQKPVTLRNEAQKTASNLEKKVKKHTQPPQRSQRKKVESQPESEQSNLATELIYNYIRCAPQSLQQFMALASAVPSMSLKLVANELNAYLNNPIDLIPDNQNGLLGYIDDAWLIHNTIYRCIEAGLFSLQDIGIQWEPIVQADPLVLKVMPAPVQNSLEQLLMQFLQTIANELSQYQPQFMPQAQFNSYGAFMGDGYAVGGESYNGPQTVDDLFITGSGKVSWVGKNW